MIFGCLASGCCLDVMFRTVVAVLDGWLHGGIKVIRWGSMDERSPGLRALC